MVMNFEDIHFWADLLWEYYSRAITDEKPFYLAADVQLIYDMLKARGSAIGFNETDALSAFHKVCGRALNSKKNGIKHDIFKAEDTSGRSAVICLAVQQVLVVEQMLADDDYSEAEYFPRYRRCLGLTPANANPLGNDFNKIWETLAAELANCCGKDKFVRTFWPGTSRKFRTSNFPLSQALFTTEDLLRIKRRATGFISQDSPDRLVFYFLQQLTKSNVLCSRARNLIRKCSAETEQRLCAQVRAFLSAPVEALALVRAGRRESYKYSFKAEQEPEDWFSEGVYFVISLSTNETDEAETTVSKALEQYLSAKAVLAFGLGDFFFTEINSDNPFEGQDRLLVVIPHSRCSTFEQKVKEMGGVSIDQVGSNVDGEFSAFLCKSVTKQFCLEFGLVNGSSKTQPELEMVGGLKIDARTNVFLTGYPPKGLRFQGALVDDETEVIFDHRLLRLNQVVENLQSVRDERRCLLEYRGATTIFSLVHTKQFEEAPILGGYGYFGSNLEPTVKPLNALDRGLRGVHLSSSSVSSELYSEDISQMQLIGLMEPGRRIQLSKDEREYLIKKLVAKSAAHPLTTIIARVISERGHVALNEKTAALILSIRHNSRKRFDKLARF